MNVLLVLSPSLETVSEVSFAALSPPMMTRLSWLTLQTLEPHLSSVRVRGSVTQPPCWTLHWRQLLSVDESYPPPHRVFPDWTCSYLSSGSAGSSHVEFCHGRNISADCFAPYPPVIRMASEMERCVLSGIFQRKQNKITKKLNLTFDSN